MNFSSKYVYKRKAKSNSSNFFDNSVITEQSEKDANLIASPSPSQMQEMMQSQSALRKPSFARSRPVPTYSTCQNNIGASMNKKNEMGFKSSIDLVDEYEPGY
jgi:hypothetical protein